MFSVRNVEKFLDDHPELGFNKSEVMEKVNDMAHNKVLSGACGEDLFGAHKDFFFDELLSDPEQGNCLFYLSGRKNSCLLFPALAEAAHSFLLNHR